MKLRSLSKIVAGFCAFFCLFYSVLTHAQTIVENQGLTFGTIILFDFNSVGQITVNSNTGSFNDNGQVYFMTDPQRGVYDVVGGPPNAAYSIILPASVTLVGPGGTFTLDNFNSFPALPVTDPSGDATFYVGARMSSQGGGVNYNDGNYNSNFDITLAF